MSLVFLWMWYDAVSVDVFGMGIWPTVSIRNNRNMCEMVRWNPWTPETTTIPGCPRMLVNNHVNGVPTYTMGYVGVNPLTPLKITQKWRFGRWFPFSFPGDLQVPDVNFRRTSNGTSLAVGRKLTRPGPILPLPRRTRRRCLHNLHPQRTRKVGNDGRCRKHTNPQ